jgi:hypothetical protein
MAVIVAIGEELWAEWSDWGSLLVTLLVFGACERYWLIPRQGSYDGRNLP